MATALFLYILLFHFGYSHRLITKNEWKQYRNIFEEITDITNDGSSEEFHDAMDHTFSPTPSPTLDCSWYNLNVKSYAVAMPDIDELRIKCEEIQKQSKQIQDNTQRLKDAHDAQSNLKHMSTVDAQNKKLREEVAKNEHLLENAPQDKIKMDKDEFYDPGSHTLEQYAEALQKHKIERAELEQIPNYSITNNQVGKCRGSKENRVFKCMLAKEYQQCPAYACGNSGSDPDCLLHHPHPVTRTEWKDEHGLCTYVKQCDYPISMLEDLGRTQVNWHKFKNLMFQRTHKFPMIQAVNDLVHFQANTVKEGAVFSFISSTKKLLAPFTALTKKGAEIMGIAIPNSVRSWWWNYYMSLIEEIVNEYFNGASLQREDFKKELMLKYGNRNIAFFSIVTVGNGVIDLLFFLYRKALELLYNYFMKFRPAIKNNLDANYLHFTKLPKKNRFAFHQKFAQTMFETVNNFLNDAVTGVLKNIDMELQGKLDGMVQEITDKIKTNNEQVIEEVKQADFPGKIKSFLTNWVPGSEHNIQKTIIDWTSNAIGGARGKIEAKVKMIDIFSSAKKGMYESLRDFTRWSWKKIDFQLRDSINAIKRSWAKGKQLDYHQGLDMGLYVAPLCDPNHRLEVELDDMTLQKMISSEVIDQMQTCADMISSKQIGSCGQKKTVNIIWHCKIYAQELLDVTSLQNVMCPGYFHKDKGFLGNVKDHRVYVNKKVVKAQLDRPAFALCTYIKNCVQTDEDTVTSLKVGNEFEFVKFGKEFEKLNKEEMIIKEKLKQIRKIKEEQRDKQRRNEKDKYEEGERNGGLQYEQEKIDEMERKLKEMQTDKAKMNKQIHLMHVLRKNGAWDRKWSNDWTKIDLDKKDLGLGIDMATMQKKPGVKDKLNHLFGIKGSKKLKEAEHNDEDEQFRFHRIGAKDQDGKEGK